jgi:hypothetical protein
MRDTESIRKAVEALVGTTLESRMAELRGSLVTQIIAHVEGLEPGGGAGPGGSSKQLNGALRSLQDSTTQTEILRSLLEGAANFCARSALLVLRGNTAQGWQARGFSDDTAVRLVSIDCTRGIAARVLESYEPVAGSFHDLTGSLAEHASEPRDGNVLVLPLIIKDKVAALLYADGGDTGALDSAAIEILVRSSAMWLELLTLRRAAGIATDVTHRSETSHAKERVAAHETPKREAPVETAPVQQPGHIAIPEAVAAPVAEVHGNGNGNGHGAAGVMEDELHNKARRFAKLLVDEIKLYNQAKVTEGKQARDLYTRLKDDIDKSRATYERRYGQINDVDYFRQELVRILADNDPTLLGASFAQSA